MCKTKHSSKEIDASSLVAQWIFSDLVGERPSSIMINFEKVIKPFLV